MDTYEKLKTPRIEKRKICDLTFAKNLSKIPPQFRDKISVI